MRRIKKLIPHFLINYFYHLPQAFLANMAYGFPSRKIRVIGITGTDGKTTTTNMIYQILKNAGKSVSMISTINAEIAGQKYETGLHVTNPSCWEIQKFLRQAVLAKNEFMVLEVTSHGLAQFRVWGVKFEVGVITNVTREHLDYHGSFQNYLQTKGKLLKKVKYAVLNKDEENFNFLAKKSLGKIQSFGLSKSARFNPKSFSLKLKIPGQYNLYNALAAAAATTALGIDKKIIRQTLENFKGLTGRMEEIKNSRGIKIIVDFAHTPNGLESALKTLRLQTKGQLLAVFGAAGERDSGKRPLMGEISAKLADITILTDEDPRFEDSSEIINQIAKGVFLAGGAEGKNLFKEPNRAKAIKLALQMAKPGDLVGIFGKGHEKSMSYFGVEKLWSDQEEVRKALQNG